MTLLRRPVASQIHGCIEGVQDIECLDELIGDNGADEHQVVNGRRSSHLRAKSSFRMVRLSPDAICRMYRKSFIKLLQFTYVKTKTALLQGYARKYVRLRSVYGLRLPIYFAERSTEHLHVHFIGLA